MAEGDGLLIQASPSDSIACEEWTRTRSDHCEHNSFAVSQYAVNGTPPLEKAFHDRLRRYLHRHFREESHPDNEGSKLR